MDDACAGAGGDVSKESVVLRPPPPAPSTPTPALDGRGRRIVRGLALVVGLGVSLDLGLGLLGVAPWSLAGLHADGSGEPPADLPALLASYGSVAARGDDEGYARQRELVERIADLNSPQSRRALEAELNRQGASDTRRASLLLMGLVRRGGPAEIDLAIAWVERARDARLLELLDRIVAAALQPEARKHLRSDALPRAVPAVKAQIARALGGMGDPEGVLPLLGLLREEHVVVRAEAVLALGALKDPRAQGPLLALLADADPRLRDAACRALGVLGRPESLSALVRQLDDPVSLVVEGAAQALSLLNSPAAVAPLIDRLGRAVAVDLRLTDSLARALERLTGKSLGTEAEPWRTWWAAVKDRPWQRATEAPGGNTVAGVRYYGFPVRTSKVIFVLDVSRSMGWNDRLETAQSELLQVLEHLPKNTRFNLVTFSDRASTWEAGLVPASVSNVRRAMAYVRRQVPVNGTGAYEALQLAFADPEADTIFFLSDGHPSTGTVVDPEVILADVRAWNRFRHTHVHAIALLLGEPPAAFQGLENSVRAEAFMRRLAEENEGRFKVVK